MIYYLYKTTNSINGKIYIGIHQTQNIDDGYLGSGKLLLTAIKKYGKKNFTHEILEFFDNENDMVEKEILVVNEEFCGRTDTYNIMPGGKYGSIKRNGLSFAGRKHTEKTKLKLSAIASKRIISDETRQKMSDNNFAKRDPEAQRLHAIEAASLPKTEEHKHNLRISAKTNGFGKSNLGKIKPKIKCPHCNKLGATHVMHRWHFDNCPANRSVRDTAL